jgi:asparagine N-glycosylation enzyme membrane subunit Stt3
MLQRLYAGDGVGVPSSAPGGGRDALTRHRLVFESIPEHPTGRSDPSVYKVFEYVPGARIEGRARPGARVSASVVLHTNRAREVRYWSEAEADASGRYVLRVPYANVGGPASVRVADRYEVRCEGEVATVAVAEAAVAGGRSVAGPDLCQGD